jgi:hypothetical protein
VLEKHGSRPSWLDTQVAALIAALADRGLGLAYEEALEVIDRGVHNVAAKFGVSPASAVKYVDEGRINDIADDIATVFEYGLAVPVMSAGGNTIALSLHEVSRLVEALSKAGSVCLAAHETASADQIFIATGHVGRLVLRPSDGVSIAAPELLLNRIVVLLQIAAEHVGDLPDEDGATAAGFAREIAWAQGLSKVVPAHNAAPSQRSRPAARGSHLRMVHSVR